jgi:hypothetical protein
MQGRQADLRQTRQARTTQPRRTYSAAPHIRWLAWAVVGTDEDHLYSSETGKHIIKCSSGMKDGKNLRCRYCQDGVGSKSHAKDKSRRKSDREQKGQNEPYQGSMDEIEDKDGQYWQYTGYDSQKAIGNTPTNGFVQAVNMCPSMAPSK